MMNDKQVWNHVNSFYHGNDLTLNVFLDVYMKSIGCQRTLMFISIGFNSLNRCIIKIS